MKKVENKIEICVVDNYVVFKEFDHVHFKIKMDDLGKTEEIDGFIFSYWINVLKIKEWCTKDTLMEFLSMMLMNNVLSECHWQTQWYSYLLEGFFEEGDSIIEIRDGLSGKTV